MRNTYRNGTRRYFIARSLIANGLNRSLTFSELSPRAGTEKPFYFKDRKSGLWLDRSESLTRLDYEIGAVITELKRQNGEEVPVPTDPERAPSPPKKPAPEPSPESPDGFIKWVQTVARPEAERRAEAGGFPPVSMRLTIESAKAFAAGIPFEYSKHAGTLHWPDDARAAVGIKSVDPATLDFKGEPKTVTVPKVETEHKTLNYMERLARAGIPIAQTGPAGTGKSHNGFALAERLFPGQDRFGLVPMTAGATTSWLTGAFTLDGWVTRPFVEIYEKGGVFLFDEMDAADPNMLLLVNNALSSQSFENPANGKRYSRSDDFIPMAAMNTLGLGANRNYTGRSRLDAATLDRWAVGRVEVGYDLDLERSLFEAVIAQA